MQDYREFIDEVLVDAESIEKRVAELGAQISQDYAGEELLIVCLLRGGMTFTADLTRYPDHPAYPGLHVAFLLWRRALCFQRQCACQP